ncbi:hypothetical protein PR048_006850 [Dryococelus australis]|uniref:Uncharacterized protein n=1 Tax=Dryococelus australis TaxID=614101 RepID=A0ABQ9IC48_9NEOP|nr:hypothetical protein PR048_006850 [Dryococelus australis]
MEVRGKRDIPEKTRRPAASSGTIPTCRNPGVTQPEIEPEKRLGQKTPGSREAMRAKRGEHGAAPECEGGWKLDIPEENPPTRAKARFAVLQCENSAVTPLRPPP